MIHSLDSEIVVKQLGMPGSARLCNEVISLVSDAPLLVGILFRVPPERLDNNTLDQFSEELKDVRVGFSISHEHSDIVHETSANQAVDMHTPRHSKEIICTASGILVSYVTTITISKQFYSTPLQLLMTLRTEARPSKALINRQPRGGKEADVRALMDVNRYRPQTVVEHTLSTPVQFVHPISVTFQVREIGPEQTMLSARIRNLLTECAITVREVTFHLDRVTSSASGEDSRGYNSGLQGRFEIVPISCENGWGVEGTAGSALVIKPQEEYTLLYSVTAIPESTMGVSSTTAQYSAPCTVYWTMVADESASAVEGREQMSGDLTQTGEGSEVSQGPPQSRMQAVAIRDTVNCLLAGAAAQRCTRMYEVDCSATWTLGSAFARGYSAGKTTAADSAGTGVGADSVQVTLQGPAVVRVGEAFKLRLAVTNASADTLKWAVLCAPTSAESDQSAAARASYVVHETESLLGDLAPNTTAAGTLTVTPLEPGRLLISDVFVTTSVGSCRARYRLRSPFQALVEENLTEIAI